VSTVSEEVQIVLAFSGREEVEECAGAAPCVFDGALAGLSQQVLEFGEDLFDRV
jgi:hypothetical protein